MHTTLPADSLWQQLDALAQSAGERPAAIDMSWSLRLDYAHLRQRARNLAGHWHARGVAPGDRVLWLGQNSARLLESLLASAYLGAIFCPVNWRQSPAELAFVIDDAQPRLIIWQQEDIGADSAEVRANDSDTSRWLQHDDPAGYESLAGTVAALPVPAATSTQPVLMLYTAAFSGRPMAALFDHRALLAQCGIFAEMKGIDANSRYLNVGPLFHVATLLETLTHFLVGACNVFIRRAEPEWICQAIEREQCNAAFLLPPTIEKIVELQRNTPCDLKRLRALPGSPAWNAMISVDDSPWGRNPYGYGQTETFGYATYNLLAPEGKGNMGLPQPALQLAMLDASGNPLPAGQVGEIALHGPTVTLGYWRRDAENAARRSNGWFRTNDLGRLEADGTLSFIGPKGRVIRSGQENIYAAEVENCLRQHPDVADCAVLGVPDPVWDQRVLAVLVARAGATLSTQAIADHCLAHMASYKKPKEIACVENLPRLDGQIDYASLKDRYGAGGFPNSLAL